MSYSQFGQDLEVIQNIFPNKRGGYFIELGAHDGITLSNTLLLEKKYGWNGLCIEPNPELFEKLKVNRSCNVSDGLAFSSEDVEINFSLGDLFGGITDHIDKYTNVKQSKQLLLKTTTLTKLLESVNAPAFIEYLSLDTEGTELEILKGINFSKYTFGFMNIEHNYVEPRRTEIKEFLKSKGYVYHSSNRVDDNFILESSLIKPISLRWDFKTKTVKQYFS
jgi:FkbM family methyltransferase